MSCQLPGVKERGTLYKVSGVSISFRIFEIDIFLSHKYIIQTITIKLIAGEAIKYLSRKATNTVQNYMNY